MRILDCAACVAFYSLCHKLAAAGSVALAGVVGPLEPVFRIISILQVN